MPPNKLTIVCTQRHQIPSLPLELRGHSISNGDVRLLEFPNVPTFCGRSVTGADHQERLARLDRLIDEAKRCPGDVQHVG